MGFSKFSQLSVLALALVSPALSCVQYSCNLNIGNGLFNAALTDNGGQKCQLTNAYVGILLADTPPIQLSCVPGYSASFSFDDYSVTYSHGGFQGNFGTVSEEYPDNEGTYWNANVWGC